MPCPSHSTPRASRLARQHLPHLRRTGDPYHRTGTPIPPVSGIGRPGGWLGPGPVAVARRFPAGAVGRSERLSGHAGTETECSGRLALVLPARHAAALEPEINLGTRPASPEMTPAIPPS